MKKFTLFKSFLALTVCAAIIFLSSCGDDEKPANQVKVDGKTIKIAHAYMLSVVGEDDDGDDASNHVIFLTSDGLKYDEEADDLVGEGDVAFMILGSEGHALKKGTYELGDDFGDAFLVQAGFGMEDAVITEALYDATGDGSVKISSISDNKITLKFNFDEYDYENAAGDGSKEETLKGYYSGKVDITQTEAIDAGRLIKRARELQLKSFKN